MLCVFGDEVRPGQANGEGRSVLDKLAGGGTGWPEGSSLRSSLKKKKKTKMTLARLA
jgi:hypothetical protein